MWLQLLRNLLPRLMDLYIYFHERTSGILPWLTVKQSVHGQFSWKVCVITICQITHRKITREYYSIVDQNTMNEMSRTLYYAYSFINLA